MKSARLMAAKALLKMEADSAWSNRTLDGMLRKSDLEARDRAFAATLFYGVLERRITLDVCIAKHSGTRLDRLSGAVLCVLRIGIYQMLYMNSVPDHAAVSSSVELTRQLRQPKAAGFVNAVLRAFLRAEKKVPLPKGPVSARLSVEYACPEPLVRFWMEQYGAEDTRRILRMSLGRPPVYIRVNTLLTTAQALGEKLEARGVSINTVDDVPDCLEISGFGALAELPEYREGLFHVQDKAGQLCVGALDIHPGQRVLDVCAAPGGKSFTMAQILNGEGELVSAELHEHRTAQMRERVAEMNIRNMDCVCADMSEYHPEFGEFDRVLCDVPCSGYGVIRRKPEIKYKPLEEFSKLPDIQYKILRSASQYCKKGARLLYATCTLNPAENTQTAERFLRENGDFVPAQLKGFPESPWEYTLIDENGGDGFYLAVFEKR